MGFYGNITNTSRTQFLFDKIYPNRYDMDNSKSTDGIYAGRFVLVEYDEATHLDTFIRALKKVENGITKFYYNPTGETSFTTLLTKGIIAAPAIIYTTRVETTPEDGYHAKDCIFYICTSELSEGSREPATFEEIVNGNGVPNYTINYNIDTNTYGSGRGYDSTVWLKTYIDGVEKYIMIAELNTVVPTFDVAADAPTQRPLVPHFDTQSTDVYYKLHWQPTWGFRIKEKSPQAEINSKNKEFQSSIDTNNYPSDEEAYHYTYSFDPNTGINRPNAEEKYNAAIFYNKAGFDKARRTYYSSDESTQNDKEGHYKDSISIAPTGQSGAEYNIHDGTSATHIDTDIQEMRILLPSLGNTISDIWDLIYGYNPNNRLRFRDVEWKDAETGKENTELGGMTRDLNTVAGCINSVHDLMGMIITTKKGETLLNEEQFAKNYIYEDNDGRYYRIHKYPLYAIIDNHNLGLEESYPSDLEYNAAYELAVKKLLKEDKEYYLILDDSGENYKVKTLNNAISALKETDKIGYQNGEYGYEFVEIEGLPEKMVTIYGLILLIKKLLEVEDSETRDTTTVTGAINTINDIIKVFEDLVPGEFLICDASGHVNSANWTTEQPFSYCNYNTLEPQVTEISKENLESKTDENRWISLSLDEEKREIELKHVFNKIDDTATTSDKNLGSENENSGINNSTDDTLKLYTPIVDAMGHVVGKNIETVTLPYGYKTILSNELVADDTKDLYTTIVQGTADNDATSSAQLDDDLNQTDASNSKDLMNINTANKWIQTKVTDDTLVIAHEIHAVKEVAREHDLNGLVEEGYHQDKITVQDTKYDAAGHVIENRKHTYTLPYGFQYITSNGRGTDTAINSETMPSNPTVQADNTQSTFALNSGNRWIRIDNIDGEINSLTFKHDIHPTSTSTSTQELEFEESKEVTFDIPTYAFDEAGHYVSHDTKTLHMPFGYGIIVGDKNTQTKASATYDTLTLNTDEWLTTTVSPDRVTFTHDYPKLETDTLSALNMNNDDNTPELKNEIVLETLNRDSKGHITHVNLHTVTLPYGYKTFKDSNTPIGSTSAKETQDTFIFAGDSWIKPTITTDKVTFTHTEPVAISATPKNNITNPKFGSTFTIEDWHYDSKGHKNNLTTHTVLFPKGSLTATEPNESDVLLLLTFTPETGTIETQRTNIAKLKLADYVKTTDNTDIVATDTLGLALSKLQTQISTEKTRINNLDMNKSADEGFYISSITLTDGKVSFGTTALPTLTTGSTNGTITFNKEEVAVAGLGSAAYTDSTNYANANILDTTFTYGTEENQKTIAQLFGIVADLATTVASLTTLLNKLKTKVETEHPTQNESEGT